MDLAPQPFWTDDRVKELSILWAEGFTARQIEARLGAPSRNAVLGKAHRLGLPARPKPEPKKPKPKGKNIYFGTGFHRRPKLATPPSMPKPVPLPPVVKPVPLHERTGCCFPVNNGKPYLFCNEPTEAHSYCAYHWRRMVAA